MLVVTARRLAVLAASGVRADVLVGSATDPGERVDADPAAAAAARDRADARRRGRHLERRPTAAGGRWDRSALPGPLRDAYGAGDCFHAVLTADARGGATMPDAVAAAARAPGPRRVTRRGAYGE